VLDAKTKMIDVRVKYYSNDGHFAIEGSEKFEVEGEFPQPLLVLDNYSVWATSQ